MIEIEVNGVTVPARVRVERLAMDVHGLATRAPARGPTTVEVELRPEWIWVDHFDLKIGDRACKGHALRDDGEWLTIRAEEPRA